MESDRERERARELAKGSERNIVATERERDGYWPILYGQALRKFGGNFAVAIAIPAVALCGRQVAFRRLTSYYWLIIVGTWLNGKIGRFLGL